MKNVIWNVAVVSLAIVVSCTSKPKQIKPAIQLPDPNPIPAETLPVPAQVEPIALITAERARKIFELNPDFSQHSDLLAAFELSEKMTSGSVDAQEFYKLLLDASVDIRNEVLRDYFRHRCNAGEKRQLSVQNLMDQSQLRAKLTDMKLSSESSVDHFAKRALRDRCFVSGGSARNTDAGDQRTTASIREVHNRSKDPMFKSVLKVACDRDGEDAWYAWARRSKLSQLETNFFKAKLAGCRGMLEGATRYGEKLMNARAQSLEDFGLQVEMGRRLVKWMRSTRSRVQLSKMYQKLVATWDRPGLLAKHVGIKDREFASERENMRIWSARYLALIGRYQQALVETTIARQHLIANKSSSKGSEKERQSLLAESFHVEAFRVLVEQGKFLEAAKLYQFAAEKYELPNSWKAKFWWYAGLFAHISGEDTLALNDWKRVSSFDPKEAYQSKVMFAIGYYTLVAGRKLAGTQGWDNDVMPAMQAYKSPFSLAQSSERTLKELIGENQWQRYLIASNIGAAKWTRLVGFEILENLRGQRKLLKNTEFVRDIYAVLSATGLHYKHISMQTLLSNQVSDFWRRYPRQFAIYFPETYRKRISVDAKSSNIDPNLVLGLIRQESSFRETVGSGAGAYGLMQITPSTARGLEPAWQGKPETFVQSNLKQADSNLRLGVKNLRNLARKYQRFGDVADAAVLAAYNAGEEVTDRWVSLRKTADPDAWIELVPFGETQKYIKFVKRNQAALTLLERGAPEALSAQ